MNSVNSQELVVLLDNACRTIGTAPKSEVHHDSTPLHLAFSCYLFDEAGHVLLTRRALDKRTFPGVWTNSFCGHPSPDESVDGAVARRAREELGVDVADLICVLPDFRYRAVDAEGILENEFCPCSAPAWWVRWTPIRRRSWTSPGCSGISCMRPRSCRGRSVRGRRSRSRCSRPPGWDGTIRTSVRKVVPHRSNRHATAASPIAPSGI